MTVSPSSTLPGLRTTPDSASMRSVTVVLPASTCANMPTLRIEESRSTERRHIAALLLLLLTSVSVSASASQSSESESSTPTPSTGTVEREADGG